MKNLYQAAQAEEIKQRIAQLQPDSQRLWGIMNAAQTLAHCSASLESVVGDRIPPRGKLMGRVIGCIIKPLVLGNDEPMRRNSQTTEDLVTQDERDLETERERLRGLIDRFTTAGPAGCTSHPHAFFGPLKPEEWAILIYKHLDHHLRQFGV